MSDANATIQKERDRADYYEDIVRQIERYAIKLGTDRDFTPLDIVEDLYLMVDGNPPDTPMED